MVTRSRSNSSQSLSSTPKIQELFVSTGKSNSAKAKTKLSASKEDTLECNKIQKQKMSPPEEGIPRNQDPRVNFVLPTNEEQWLMMFKTLNSTLTSINTEISDLKKTQGSISSFTPIWKAQIESAISDAADVKDDLSFKVNLLTNVVIKQEQKIQELEDKLKSANQRELRSNLVIEGIEEDPGETRASLQEKVEEFFKDQMEIEDTIDVLDIYHTNQADDKKVVVKLQHQSDKALIYRHASNLKGKESVKKKLFFAKDDLTTEQREQQTHFRLLRREGVEADDDLKFSMSMKKGHMYANNQLVVPKVLPPTAAEILHLSLDERQVIKAVKLAEGKHHAEQGSEFYSFAVKVKSVQEVKKAYMKVRIKHADATHVCCAYRLDKPNGPFKQESIDDGEIGASRVMMQVMKEKEVTQTAVFVVRHYGGKHLGKRRHDIYRFQTESALKAINSRINKIKQRANRLNSQSLIALIPSSILSEA